MDQDMENTYSQIIPTANKPLTAFELSTDWTDAAKSLNPLLETDILIYRSPLKLEWLKNQEKFYGRVGKI